MVKVDNKSKIQKKSDWLACLPKYWTHQRELVYDYLLKSEEYEKTIKEGRPFFKREELEDLNERYKYGITWNQIDAELGRKKWMFKKATFRKYVQEKMIPASYGYKVPEKGRREALYPVDVIKHINFIQYLYKFTDKEFLQGLYEIFSKQTIYAKDAIEEQLLGRNILEGVFMYLRGIDDPGENIEKAIEDVLSHDKELCEKVKSGLSEIGKAFDAKFKDWVNMLEKHTISISKKE